LSLSFSSARRFSGKQISLSLWRQPPEKKKSEKKRVKQIDHMSMKNEKNERETALGIWKITKQVNH